MSLATKQSQSAQLHPLRRIWKAPTSKARLLWLAGSILLYGGIFLWYLYALRTQQFPAPINDPLRLFGIVAFVLVLGTAAYSLRRRFMRGLPGKVQNWLWMHTWVGITTILIALLHENFAFITHDFCQGPSCLTDTYWGASALFALILLVISGIVGRLLDMWQAHMIARDASANGIGIIRALEERILELEYTVERLCAGKSEPFKQYCLQALGQEGKQQGMPEQMPPLAPSERGDFQRAHDTLSERAILVQSLRQQQRARLIIRTWRSVHMVLACLALIVILYHGVMELLANVFHLITPA
jgi:cytochrome b561